MDAKTLRKFFTGSALENESFRRRRSVIVFLFLVLCLNMCSTFQSQKTYKKLNDVKKEVMTLRAKAAVNNAERIRITRESSITKLLENYNINLKRSTEPPKKLD